MDAEEYYPRIPVEPVQRKPIAVAKKVSLANIKRFTHEEFVTMFREDMRAKSPIAVSARNIIR